MQTLWEQRYAQRTQQMKSSAIREILKLTEEPDIISFAGGLPASNFFPVQAMREASQRILSDQSAAALQYGTTEGYRPLREMIAEDTERYGPRLSPDNVLVTSGSQQALDLLGKVFINPGDHILVESPTYLGALQVWSAYGAEYVTVPTDADGMQTPALEAALRTGPKFIYVLPNFQNPTGVTMSLERRERLVELADHYGVPIIEDDPYGQLRYAGVNLQTVASLDAEMHDGDDSTYTGNVIYLSTFSKTLAPGLRVAWVVAPAAVIRKLVQAKQGADLHTATFNQILAYEVSKGGFLARHVRMLRDVYRERRDAMLAAMEAHFPPGVQWTRPDGGLFLWVTLPAGASAAELLRAAIAHKVAFIPGGAFHPCGGGENTLRLNFSFCPPDTIREGIARLGQVMREQLPAYRPPVAPAVPMPG
ncbi:MAG: PLP-dependent aminotransferase family protein [Chloroflexi bacterium]|nr:PLP-dependent aminotransferase family protein [Chloroflexota bacterium]